VSGVRDGDGREVGRSETGKAVKARGIEVGEACRGTVGGESVTAGTQETSRKRKEMAREKDYIGNKNRTIRKIGYGWTSQALFVTKI